MNILVNDVNIFYIILITFVSSLILVPLIRDIAKHINAMDIPDKRKVHKKPMPRLGGLAIFLSFLVGYMFFAPLTTQMISILIGSFLIVLLGIIDDINPLKATTKLWGQILVAIILVFFGNIYITDISLFGMNVVLGGWTYPVSILFIVACINSINLIDGLDGLAAGISSIYFITIIVLSILLGRIDNLGFILCLITLGATLGFLYYNFNPASIFMGDTGSMFLGFMIAVVALLGFKTATLTSFMVPILILFIPILDTLLAILRRLIKGESIGKPDKEHVHFQLLTRTSSVKKTVIIIYIINILFSSVSVLYAIGKTDIAMFLYISLMILVIIFIFKTDILYKHEGKHKK